MHGKFPLFYSRQFLVLDPYRRNRAIVMRLLTRIRAVKRFILLCFIFLGIGFYELSGGDDFDPQDTRLAIIEARQMREAARQDALPEPVFAATTPAPDVTPAVEENVVARAQLNLVSFSAVVSEPEPEPTEVVDWASDDNIADTPEPVSIASLAETTAEERSIVFPGAVIGASSDAVATPSDIRKVTGSLVNVRSGPGTSFGVVTQLSQDAEVEVIDDSGTGWLELRPLDGGPSGWMADFLLSKG